MTFYEPLMDEGDDPRARTSRSSPTGGRDVAATIRKPATAMRSHLQARNDRGAQESSTADLAKFFRNTPPAAAAPMASQPKNAAAAVGLQRRSSVSTEKNNVDLSICETDPSGQSRQSSHEKLHTPLQSFELTCQSTQHGLLYKDGVLVRQPAPTSDPKDPLNLSLSRRLVAVFFLCFFGALAAAAELILGAMLPVFALEYAGIDPKLLIQISKVGGIPAGSDPLKTLQDLPNAPPITMVYLLASLPVLIMGISNLGLVPMAISVGRRPVFLVSGVVAIVGAVWAGNSHSLGSHLGARAVQAIGAGTVESLIPFIIQDMIFVHKRNTWMSCIFAAQGIIIIGLGIATPYIIIDLSWRYVYFITAGFAAFFLLGVFFFVPETKFNRTQAEMSGIPRIEDGMVHSPRTWKSDLAFTNQRPEWQKGWNAFLDTLRTFFYPQIFFITMLNSTMIAGAFAAGYTVAPALLTQPWSWEFLHIGWCLLPMLFAAVAVAAVTGFMADWIANMAAKRSGRRTPEHQLLNLILPTLSAIIGALIFGLAGSHMQQYHWAVFLFGLGLMGFGFLGANTVGAVYVLECYPHLAGPALVNIASFRCLIAFILSFRVSEWIADWGYLTSMMIYVGIIGFCALLIPVVYFYGPAWRKRWPATHRGDAW